MSKDKKERLDKCVAKVFSLTRTQAFGLIKNQRISVNSKVICDPAFKISLDTLITLDNDIEASACEGFKKRAFMLNKPKDYVCADRDRQHMVAVGLFADEPRFEQLHCAGRLDIDTTGLIIISDDGNLIHEITAPKKNIEKVYLATTNEAIPNTAIELFAKGLKHKEEAFRYKSAKLEIIDSNLGKVTVTEGRFHEVKRLFECVGLEVIELQRIQIGKLLLDENLEEGEYRILSDDEISLIFK